MFRRVSLLIVAISAVGCRAVTKPQGSASLDDPRAAQTAMPAIPPGRTVSSLNQVQIGDQISVLQIIDKSDTWITGQVSELSQTRLTLTQCQVETRTYSGEKKGARSNSAARYSLPPEEVRAIRAM